MVTSRFFEGVGKCGYFAGNVCATCCFGGLLKGFWIDLLQQKIESVSVGANIDAEDCIGIEMLHMQVSLCSSLERIRGSPRLCGSGHRYQGEQRRNDNRSQHSLHLHDLKPSRSLRYDTV